MPGHNFGRSANLAIDEVVTSQINRTEKYDAFRYLVRASHDGSLAIQQSTDGVNWDKVDTVAITGGTTASGEVSLVGAFLRTVYTNGGTGTTSFRMTGRFHNAGED